MVLHLNDIVFHSIFKYGIVVQINQSYCTVYFENKIKKMFIIDKNHFAKNLMIANITLEMFIEKKLYLGVYDKSFENQQLDKIENIYTIPSHILGTFSSFNLNLKLLNGHFSSYCDCKNEFCKHTYSLLKTYEQTILHQSQQIQKILEILKKININEKKMVSTINTLYSLINNLSSYNQLCKTIFNEFNRISNYPNVYNAICICLINNNENDFINECSHINSIFGYEIKNKITSIQSYFSYYLANQVTKPNMHKFYLLNLICHQQFKDLFQDMKCRLLKYDISTFDATIFETFVDQFSNEEGFIEYYLKIKEHFIVKIDFQPIFENLSDTDKKEMIMCHPIPDLMHIYLPYMSSFNEEEIYECLTNFSKNSSGADFTFSYLYQLYPIVQNSEKLINTILKIICNEFDKHYYISYDAKETLIKLLLQLPHHQYLIKIFNSKTMYNLLHKEGDNND